MRKGVVELPTKKTGKGRGFASMSERRHREVSAKGGRASGMKRRSRS
jgi:hypothetical protein